MSKWCVVTPRLSGVYIWSKEYWNTTNAGASTLTSGLTQLSLRAARPARASGSDVQRLASYRHSSEDTILDEARVLAAAGLVGRERSLQFF